MSSARAYLVLSALRCRAAPGLPGILSCIASPPIPHPRPRKKNSHDARLSSRGCHNSPTSSRPNLPAVAPHRALGARVSA